MANSKQKFVAFDREVLLGRSIGLPPHMEAVEFFARIRFLPMVTPTIMAVIKDAELNGKTPRERQLAQLIIQDVLDSNILRPPISDTYKQVMDIHAEKLLATNVLNGGNKADALILVEASLLEADVLLTINPFLKSAQTDSLKVALLECGLDSVVIISPKEIVDYLQLVKKSEATSKPQK